MKNDFLCPNYIILSEDKTSNVCWINPYPKRDLSATVIDTVAQRRPYASFWHAIGRNNYFRVIMAISAMVHFLKVSAKGLVL